MVLLFFFFFFHFVLVVVQCSAIDVVFLWNVTYENVVLKVVYINGKLLRIILMIKYAIREQLSQPRTIAICAALHEQMISFFHLFVRSFIQWQQKKNNTQKNENLLLKSLALTLNAFLFLLVHRMATKQKKKRITIPHSV